MNSGAVLSQFSESNGVRTMDGIQLLEVAKAERPCLFGNELTEKAAAAQPYAHFWAVREQLENTKGGPLRDQWPWRFSNQDCGARGEGAACRAQGRRFKVQGWNLKSMQNRPLSAS